MNSYMRNICSIYESCIGFMYGLAYRHIHTAYMRSIYAAYTVFFHGIISPHKTIQNYTIENTATEGRTRLKFSTRSRLTLRVYWPVSAVSLMVLNLKQQIKQPGLIKSNLTKKGTVLQFEQVAVTGEPQRRRRLKDDCGHMAATLGSSSLASQRPAGGAKL